MEIIDRRRLGAYDAAVRDIRHVRIFHDPNRYAGHVNRGGIWNFGDGELVVAHRVKTVDYRNADWLAAGAHDFSHLPAGATSGIMLNRSLDGGETWPESEKAWIWNNERSTDELLEWLRPREPDQRERIDLSHADAVMHLSPAGEHLRWPLGGAIRPNLGSRDSFHLGKRDFRNMPSFCLRSGDRGRTWERHPTLIEGPSISPDTGFLAANLGHVAFDNGVLGIVGTTNHRSISCFYVSYDNGISWEYVSEVARGVDPDCDCGYTYMGVHRLPDGRLMTLHAPHAGELAVRGVLRGRRHELDGAALRREPRHALPPGQRRSAASATGQSRSPVSLPVRAGDPRRADRDHVRQAVGGRPARDTRRAERRPG